jgi:hypothetical protein
MGLQATILSAVDTAIKALGDLVIDAQRAIVLPTPHVPGQSPARQFEVSDAIVAVTVVDVDDFPGTSIEVFDKSMMDIKPSVETNPGSFYYINGRTFKVVKSKHTYAGDVLAISQHLIRPEKVEGVAWR